MRKKNKNIIKKITLSLGCVLTVAIMTVGIGAVNARSEDTDTIVKTTTTSNVAKNLEAGEETPNSSSITSEKNSEGNLENGETEDGKEEGGTPATNNTIEGTQTVGSNETENQDDNQEKLKDGSSDGAETSGGGSDGNNSGGSSGGSGDGNSSGSSSGDNSDGSSDGSSSSGEGGDDAQTTPTITITQNPSNQIVKVGDEATFSVQASVSPDTAELTFSWEVSTDNGLSYKEVGCSSASYTITNVQNKQSNAMYRCKVTSGEVTETSDPAMLIVQATGYTVTVTGGTATPDSAEAGTLITITANEATDGYEFKEWIVEQGSIILQDADKKETVFTMPSSDVKIKAEFVKQLEAPVITTQPEKAEIYAGESASFKVEATGEELEYQWQVDKTDGKGFQKLTGATDAVLRVYTQDASMNGYKYKCIVSNRSASVESKEAVLTVNYKITEGAYAVWKKGSSDGLTFQGSGEYSKFRSVKIDEEYIGAGNYTKKGDPTIINMIGSYLETLSTGDHEITMIWEDGTAKTVFTVAEGTTTRSSSGSASGNSGGSSSASQSGAGGSAGSSSTQGTDTSSVGDTTGSTTDIQAETPETADAGDELVDMPIVSWSAENQSSELTSESQSQKTARNMASYLLEGENGSVISSLDGNLSENPSKLNQYAASASIIVILMCVAGAIAAFLVRGVWFLCTFHKKKDR